MRRGRPRRRIRQRTPWPPSSHHASRASGARSPQPGDARSPCWTAAWPRTGKSAPEEEIIVATETPDTRAAAAEGGTRRCARRAGAEAAGPGAGRHRDGPAYGRARPDHRHRRPAAHPGRAGVFRVNLEWVVNAYAVAFGGLLLLGGRSGDLLGRRRIFIAGLLVFVLASLLGGLATDQAWLITARAVQGAGAAMVAPTALSLIAVTFPEGRGRNRATGGVLGDGHLGHRGRAARRRPAGHLPDWRWVLFVNVPIGLVVAALARPRAARHRTARRAAGPARRGYRDGRGRRCWCTGCPTPRPPRTASRTGATPRWSRRWPPPRCCWPRSR